MSSYKLYYFNVRARAEVARWLFAEAGVKYEDIRLQGEEWANKKSELPFHQMPVLEVTESGCTVPIAQSHAIDRFLAREFNLAGKTSLDVARGDMLDEQMRDIKMKLQFSEKDEAVKAKLAKEALDGPVAKGFKLLENFVQDSGYFVGDSVTLADIEFTVGCEWLERDYPNILDETPKLKILTKKVRALPKIAEWIAKRPVTKF